MNPTKQQKKILKAQQKAEACESREDAKKILEKYEKAQIKLLAAHILQD